MVWNAGREINSKVYSREHIAAILGRLGFEPQSETVHDFLILCPFHYNTDSPSLSISKTTGEWICFNPSCWERGSLLDFVQRTSQMNYLEAMRLIQNCQTEDITFGNAIIASMSKRQELREFPEQVLTRLHADFWNSEAHKYMKSRGFDDHILSVFQAGYSEKKSMVTIPVHDDSGMPIGLVGRSIRDKRFENSVGLPVASILFNYHRAKSSSKVVITESAFDTMRVVQAGYSAVGTLGGNFSQEKQNLLNRSFTSAIIMTDNDAPQFHNPCARCGAVCKGHNPGQELGLKIADSFSRLAMWASYSDTEIFPHKAKDAGDMTDEEISRCIENAISDIEFRTIRMV